MFLIYNIKFRIELFPFKNTSFDETILLGNSAA